MLADVKVNNTYVMESAVNMVSWKWVLGEKVEYDQRVGRELSVVVGNNAYWCKIFLNTQCMLFWEIHLNEFKRYQWQAAERA